MQIGLFLPISGRAAGPEVLTEAAQQAERLGFDAVWSADRVVTPWHIQTTYPYSEDHEFIVPPDRPFLDSMSVLAYLAGRTERIALGISVLVLPYRHPIYWARVAVSVERLAAGRFIMGVGVGWMREEFDALGVPFEARGRMADEQLEVVAKLWSQDHASHQGEFYRFDDLAFHPRPMQGRLPIWVGGEGRPARRRAGRYGDAWFPYFIDTTAEELAAGMNEVRRFAVEAGRDPGAVSLTACRAIEITPEPVTQDPRRLRGTTEQVSEALEAYRAAGVEHLALQFIVPRWPERKEQIERFASEAMPAPR